MTRTEQARKNWQKGAWVSALALLLFAAGRSRAEAVGLPPKLNGLVAAIVFNVAKFTAWGKQKGPEDSNAPIRFLVLKNKSLAAQVTELVAGKSINSRPIEVSSSDSFEAKTASGYEVAVVIPAESYDSIASDLAKLNGCNCLVITFHDKPELVNSGLSLFVVGEHVRFAVNRTGIESENLKLNAQLLKLGYSIP